MTHDDIGKQHRMILQLDGPVFGVRIFSRALKSAFWTAQFASVLFARTIPQLISSLDPLPGIISFVIWIPAHIATNPRKRDAPAVPRRGIAPQIVRRRHGKRTRKLACVIVKENVIKNNDTQLHNDLSLNIFSSHRIILVTSHCIAF